MTNYLEERRIYDHNRKDKRRRYRVSKYAAVTYKCFNADGEVIYVGKSIGWNQRLWQHENHSSWWHEVTRIQIRKRKDEADAWVLEALLFRRHRPKYNVDGNRGGRSLNFGKYGAEPIEV